jgi:hypothetical protein
LVERFIFGPLTDETRIRFPGWAILVLLLSSSDLVVFSYFLSFFAIDVDAVVAVDALRD